MRAEFIRIPSRSELLTFPAPLDFVHPEPRELMIVRTVFGRLVVENQRLEEIGERGGLIVADLEQH